MKEKNHIRQNSTGEPQKSSKRIDYFFVNLKSQDGTTSVIPQSMTVIKDYS